MANHNLFTALRAAFPADLDQVARLGGVWNRPPTAAAGPAPTDLQTLRLPLRALAELARKHQVAEAVITRLGEGGAVAAGLAKLVGVRLTTQQAAKFVPLAGQAVSAALTYSALKYVCEQHIQQCASVARQLALPAPAEAPAPATASNPGSTGCAPSPPATDPPAATAG